MQKDTDHLLSNTKIVEQSVYDAMISASVSLVYKIQEKDEQGIPISLEEANFANNFRAYAKHLTELAEESERLQND